VTVSLIGSEPSGLAAMLAELIEQNLARSPGRRRLLRPTVAVLDARDAEVVVHLRIDESEVRVGDGDVPDAQLRVATTSERLLELTTVPLRLGLPDALDPAGRAVLWALVTRRLRIRGLLRHPIRLARLTSLLSVAG
jgi:hypothetical protein